MSLLWILVAIVLIISGLISALGSAPRYRFWPSIAMGILAVALIVLVLIMPH